MAEKFCFGCYDFRPATDFTISKLQRAKCDPCLARIKAKAGKTAARKRAIFDATSKRYVDGTLIIMGMDT